MHPTVPSTPTRSRAIHHLGEWYLYFGKLILLATVIWIVLLMVADHAG